MDFLLTITPVRRLLITNCLLCRGEEWWVRIPIFGWSDRNFRCIIYSRFNEPRKRSKGPRGLFLIIRRTREGRVSRSPFPPLPSFLLRTSSPPSPPSLLLLPRFQCCMVFYPSSLLRFLRSPRPPPRSTILYCRAAGAVLLVSSFFRLLFAGGGEARRLICLIQIVHRNGAPSVSVSQRFNRRTGDFKF